jgi:curved DNA-binding protein CbpA
MEHIGFINESANTPLTPLSASSQSGESKSDEDDRAKALMAEYIKLRTADYFTILGVSRTATDKEISAAFKTRQQRYHPDTLIGIDTGLVHEKAEELYVRVHNAYRTLIDPGARQRYVERLDNRVETASIAANRTRTQQSTMMPAKKKDVMLFDEGSEALRNGEFNRACELFKQAQEHSPDVRYEAYHAWASYLASPDENRVMTEKILTKLSNQHPRNVLLPYLLGNMALREKDNQKAATFFTAAIKIDPQHIESARQLRLLRMRQRKTETSGLFDIFKKK